MENNSINKTEKLKGVQLTTDYLSLILVEDHSYRAKAFCDIVYENKKTSLIPLLKTLILNFVLNEKEVKELEVALDSIFTLYNVTATRKMGEGIEPTIYNIDFTNVPKDVIDSLKLLENKIILEKTAGRDKYSEENRNIIEEIL